MRDEIAGITRPTLVMGGTIDLSHRPPAARRLPPPLGITPSCIFEGCGHGPHRDNPDGAEKGDARFSERVRRMALALAGLSTRHLVSVLSHRRRLVLESV